MITDFNAIHVGNGQVSVTTYDDNNGLTHIQASDISILGVSELTIHYLQPEQARKSHRLIYRGLAERGGRDDHEGERA